MLETLKQSTVVFIADSNSGWLEEDHAEQVGDEEDVNPLDSQGGTPSRACTPLVPARACTATPARAGILSPIIDLTNTPTQESPTLGSTLKKRKRSSVFALVMEATKKMRKHLLDAMDRINSTQQKLEKTKVRANIKMTKKHIEYLKARDKKILKMNKQMVNVLSNLSTTMCHAFIKDPTLIPAPVNLSQSSDEQPPFVKKLESSDNDAHKNHEQ